MLGVTLVVNFFEMLFLSEPLVNHVFDFLGLAFLLLFEDTLEVSFLLNVLLLFAFNASLFLLSEDSLSLLSLAHLVEDLLFALLFSGLGLLEGSLLQLHLLL